MAICVTASGDPRDARLTFGDLHCRCAIGAGGVAEAKREGDQRTPLGTWAFRRVFYRPDRIAAPRTRQRLVPIDPTMGWSDDPRDPEHYNRLVPLPYPGSHETLWRDDHLYDIVVELGYNDDPPVPGLGSAIFMHVARPDYGPTQGCVALQLDELVSLLAAADRNESVTIRRAL
jgi:L,D-peptidoglycan transpeptidase YkuD (ErfK/YbiS/YcfS/YnhG family)